jgi:protease-4
MLAYAIYLVRLVFWALSNVVRRLKRAPDYVVFTLEGSYPELRQRPGNFWQRKLSPPPLSLQELAEQFRTVAGDPRVQGVVLHLRPLNMPLAQLQSLCDHIRGLRIAGKRVIAWSHSYENSNYYVACAADEILLQKGGSIDPLGFHQRYLFLADALARVGIKADIVQISPYKSAGDFLTRTQMSDEVREMANWLFDDLYDEFLRGIADGRRLDERGAKALVDQSPFTDLQAKDMRAVDELISEEDLPVHLGSAEKPARLMPWEQACTRLQHRPLLRPGRYIALLCIEGDIVDGRSGRPPIKPPFRIPLLLNPRAGDLSVVQEARRVLADRRAAAVVLYVDSGGGSATASEAMSAALEKVAAHKPLIVAMGSVAASGGYYVSTPAHWIIAQPSTITGSIGVLNGKIVSAGLLNKLLFHHEIISRGEHATFSDTSRPFTEEERKIAWQGIQRIYDVFLDRVTASRKLSREAVDAVGGGRVWTGRQALKHQLIDELGGIDKALEKARHRAGLHEQTPVREVRIHKQPLAPVVPEPAGLVSYLREGIRLLKGTRALCLCPLIGYEVDW